MTTDVSTEIIEFLRNANRPQLGSFGEAVFCATVDARGMTATPLHDQRTDFLVAGKRVDVKTSTRYLTGNIPCVGAWRGRREPGISYALVEFHRGGARVSWDSQELGALGWNDLLALWQHWKSGGYRRPHTPTGGASRKLPDSIRAAVEGVFRRAGHPPPFILHRTCRFHEGPHNLRPSQRPVGKRLGWTVYLMFATSPPTSEGLAEIVAFEDSREHELPKLKRASLGNKIKADMKRLPLDVRFRDLEVLERALQVERARAP